MSRYDDEAVYLYPELCGLVAMREAGWRFRPHFDERGEVVLLDGVRPEAGWTDVVRVRDRADALGLRFLPDGKVVWERHGTLPEIVHELWALRGDSAGLVHDAALGSA